MKSIIGKTKNLKMEKELIEEIKKEEGATDWSVKIQRVARKGRFEELKKMKLI